MKVTNTLSKRGFTVAFTLILTVSLFLTGCNVKSSQGAEPTSTQLIDTSRPIVKENATEVTIDSGKIVGGYADSAKTVATWRGIPYAKDASGDLRWKPPQPVEPWTDMLDCTQWGDSAMQGRTAANSIYPADFLIEEKAGISEDGLNLNIWSDMDGNSNKPVLVYLHGGGFTTGGSSVQVYDGTEIARQGVVFISINYRLGILGFLATSELRAEDPEGSVGNYAVLDAIAALKWIQRNIAEFGGDPNNVTVMGQSAGASLVQVLISSPKANGLFQRAVSVSFNNVFIDKDDDWNAVEQCVAEGDSATQGHSLEQLRTMPYDELRKLSANWRPCIDGVVLTDTFAGTLASGKANDIDLLMGGVDGDSSLFNFKDEDDGSLLGVEKMVGLYNVVAELRKPYNGKTYLYLFSHVMPGAKDWGAFHTSDIPYWLNVIPLSRTDYWQQEDVDLSNAMSAYLVNFCNTGDPNGSDLTVWDANMGDYSYMWFNSGSQMEKLSVDKISSFEKLYADSLP